jgi:hypothetical protein
MICSDAGIINRLLSKCFSTILIIAVCIFFVTSQGAADPILKSVGPLKASSLEVKKLKVPIVRVSVPVQIMDLPVPWQEADLLVDASVYFYKGNDFQTGVEGYAAGRTIKANAFTNGSTQGMVYVFLNEIHGITTGQYVTLSIVFAKLGDQCKVLGVGWNFPSGSGGVPTGFEENIKELVDKVIPWQETIFTF